MSLFDTGSSAPSMHQLPDQPDIEVAHHGVSLLNAVAASPDANAPVTAGASTVSATPATELPIVPGITIKATRTTTPG
jgi:hypothetical protein